MVHGKILSVMLIAGAVAAIFPAFGSGSAGATEGEQYPFAYSTELYGYVPEALYWVQTAFLIFHAFEDSTDVEVRELGTGTILGQGTIHKWEALTVWIDRDKAFKVVSNKPITGLLGSPDDWDCPGMSFVPSYENEGREFVFDFPYTWSAYGLPYQHCFTLFAWEGADVVVTDAVTGDTAWDGHLDSGYYHTLAPPEGRYSVTSTGVLTVELVLAYDNSTFILDEDQDGCGTEFMFHIFSVGLDYGRHSYYEVHAFQDCSVTVYNIDDPSSPILFDQFALSERDHDVKTFDYYDNVFRIESTGKISVMAGSYQTDIGGVPGAQSIGDLYTSVPSLDGEGKYFLLGLHCPNSFFHRGGFALIGREENTIVHVREDTFSLDEDEWTWIPQPDTGILYYEIISDKPIHIFTGSIGGDDNFDNVMTYLSGFHEGLTGILEEDRKLKIETRRSLLNEPNPFRRSTMISYSLPAGTQVTLQVFDITGRLVEVLVDEVQGPGGHQVQWERKDRASGIYFCRLHIGDSMDTKKMVLLP